MTTSDVLQSFIPYRSPQRPTQLKQTRKGIVPANELDATQLFGSKDGNSEYEWRTWPGECTKAPKSDTCEGVPTLSDRRNAINLTLDLMCSNFEGFEIDSYTPDSSTASESIEDNDLVLPASNFQSKQSEAGHGEPTTGHIIYKKCLSALYAQPKATKQQLTDMKLFDANDQTSTMASKENAISIAVPKESTASFADPSNVEIALTNPEGIAEAKEKIDNYHDILDFMQNAHEEVLREHANEIQILKEQLKVKERETVAYTEQIETLKAQVAELALDSEQITHAKERSQSPVKPRSAHTKIPRVAHPPQRSKAALKREAKGKAEAERILSCRKTINHINNLYSQPKANGSA